MKRTIVAFSFLTRLPTPQIEADADDFAAAIRRYPIVGLVIGAIVAIGGWATSQLDPWFGALAALALWVAITGALHLDGLGDLADGLGARHANRERFLAVMADPHIGSFGVVAILIQLMAKLVLLHALLPVWWTVILVPAAARIGPLAWARWLPPLRPGGLGVAVAKAARWRDVAGWGALLAAGTLLSPALLAAPILIAGWGWWLGRRVGGVSGDCHGAGIEMVETGLLVALLAFGRF
ncbi:adenosylcobinamide-GDP ribazoletransferase [Sphingomonas montana]|uniref:adenosylcobinamide-GDP ribazoletransferase n=1 Tax=Sphingomonas montana TaxID=1843236 RepID=UPI00096DE450|nr:adenosylcobinamide-GDP ribazoletransferase [Sphingomonas montana]